MHTYTFNGVSFGYELFVPGDARPLLPLVVYMKADDGDGGAQYFTCAANQQRRPSFVLVPEARDWTLPQNAQALQRLIFRLRRQHEMDICRTYLVGQGMGAVDAWHLLGSYPRLFAGTVAVGGCGDPYRARNAKFAPVWAFHAAGDENINVSARSRVRGRSFLAGSRRLIAALRTAGGELARYTQCEGNGAGLADSVFGDENVLSWLYEQDRKKVLWVDMIRPGIYKIDDWFMSSCYLVTGTERALLIDTTMAHGDLMDTVRKLTPLPLSLAVTHPHLDHMLHAYAFDTVYFEANDARDADAYLQQMAKAFRGGGALRILTHMAPPFLDEAMELKSAVGLENGDVIDLGGGVRVEMRSLGGHMQNHVVFVDHGHRCVFTGDAVGSGFVVGVNYREGTFRETYSRYRDNLAAFIDYMAPLGEYTYFGGHYIQENSCDDPMQEDYLSAQSEYFVPLSFEVVQDMKTLCDKLLAGEYNDKIDPNTGCFFVTHGSASLDGRRL